MSQNTDTLIPVVDLILDGVMDGIQAVENGKNVVADAPLLMQLIQDASAAGGKMSGVPAAIKSMSTDDVEALVAHVVSKMTVADEHARLVLNAALEAGAKVAELIIALASKPAAQPAS